MATDFKSLNRTLPKMMTPQVTSGFVSVYESSKVDGVPTGKKEISFILDPDANPADQKFLEKLSEVTEKGVAALDKKHQAKAYTPMRPELDDDDNETGRFIVKASTKADNNVTVVDSQNRPTRVKFYSGSTVRVACKPGVYSHGTVHGVKLYLNAVQVITPMMGGSAFDVVEDGFVDDGFEPVEHATSAPDAADDDSEF